jgi:hypothetical protein
LKGIRLFPLRYRKLQGNWQSFNAYSRVAMTVGTLQLLGALCTFTSGHYMLHEKNVVAGWVTTLAFSALLAVIFSLDLFQISLQKFRIIVFVLGVLPRLLFAFATTMYNV